MPILRHTQELTRHTVNYFCTVLKGAGNFKGTKTVVGPGGYLNFKERALKDNSISSIRLVSPMGR